SSGGVEFIGCSIIAAPEDHCAAGPHCRVNCSRSGRVVSGGGCPTVGIGIISPAGVQIAAVANSAPDDHFAAGPYCCGKCSASGRGGGAGRCPTVGAGIVSPAGVKKAAAI